MQMLRVFWDEAVALDPAVAARDERNMPLCRPGELAALWREHGLAQVEEQPLTIRMSFPPSRTTGNRSSAGKVRPAPMSRVCLRLGATRFVSRIRQRLVGNGPDRPIQLEARAWAVKGVHARPRRSQSAFMKSRVWSMLRWLALLVFVCACGSSQPPVGPTGQTAPQEMDEYAC